MPLSEAQRKEFQQAVQRLGRKHGSCPICGKKPWHVFNSLFGLVEYDSERKRVAPQGEAMPLLALTCPQCGYTTLFHASYLSGSRTD